jgi:hypothetical protein
MLAFTHNAESSQIARIRDIKQSVYVGLQISGSKAFDHLCDETGRGPRAARLTLQASEMGRHNLPAPPLGARIRSQEQVTICFTPEQGSPATTAMLGAIMVHVAALTEGREVRVGVVAGVVIAVGGRQHDPCCTDSVEFFDGRQGLKSSP